MVELLKYSICIQNYNKKDNTKFPHIKVKSIFRLNTQTRMFKYNLYSQIIYIDYNLGLELIALKNTIITNSTKTVEYA